MFFIKIQIKFVFFATNLLHLIFLYDKINNRKSSVFLLAKIRQFIINMLYVRTISSVGRASASRAEGQRFEPFIVHHSSFKRKKIKLQYFHKSVLQAEAVAGLNVIPGKVYVDATGGGGGHSGLILKQLAGSGQLIILDRDPDACKALLQRFYNNSNVKIVKTNFANLTGVLQDLGVSEIAGIIMDLGISSYQIDNAARGFCYNKAAHLDMRMEKVGRSAKDIVNTYSVEELTHIFKEYGEEKFAFKIAKHIEVARKDKLIKTTNELNAIIEEAIPQFAKKTRGHSSKRVFQAIRIEVNRELESLREGLQAGFKVLMAGGRISVITFHSLEDRIVKNMFRQFVGGCICPKEFPVCVCGGRITANVLTKRPILPSKEEIEQNKRAKSAKLRILEKC